MLQQLNSIMASKPAEKAFVRQGRFVFQFFFAVCVTLENVTLEKLGLSFQRKQRILHAFPFSGSANGLTTLTNTGWVSVRNVQKVRM